MNRRSVRLEDVAKEAGVSKQTVSRVLNNPSVVSVATREKVIKSMQVLHYISNHAALLLAGKSLPTIGLISASLRFHAPSQIAASIKDYAEENQYQVAISTPPAANYPSLQVLLNEYRAQGIRGVIIGLSVETDIAEMLVQENTDMVCLFLDVSPEADVSSLCFSHQEGCQGCVQHLWDLGHREFSLLAGPQDSVAARLRLKCWRESLHQLGIQNYATVFGDWSARSGWENTFELLRLNPKLTAIIVASDQMALGVLNALEQLNKTAGRHISVTGFDDTEDSAFYRPTLTTVSQNLDELGRKAIEWIIKLIANPHQKITSTLPTKIVIRQSTFERNAETPYQDAIAQLKKIVADL
ncbi:TPA: substrate-binding domain-containing protein [Kluyvera georgiana]|uniref:LacI family DNA-binding transcriptional regulator n=1 Tax=Kluyvera georgiana TaxID=73098 RepID=UPI002303E072|nr:LacI family DNA-binding transcriptional regulator [Kluyvera georgiana]MDA8494279.1 LacI family DNA-binding transcriptional regulator [Kluyvera georgiana]HDG1689445.1 substrate-binding domain-containing protein [Kluyvera georgiana]